MFYVQRKDDHGAIVRIPFDGSEEYGFVCAECGKYEDVTFDEYFAFLTTLGEPDPYHMTVTCPRCTTRARKLKDNNLKIITGGLSR